MSIALVGAGFIGPVHVEALRRLGRPVSGIFASTPEKGVKAAQSLGIPKSYAAFDDLLADPAIQVVHITSPNRHHFPQAKAALLAGKHVVCEKPLAMTSAESAELVEVARSANRVAAVCYNIRYYPLCLEARQRIAASAIGDVLHVTGSYVQDWLLFETDFNWRVLAEDGGLLRAVADIGTHWLDLVQAITGLHIDSVCADLKTILPTRRRPKGGVETFQSKLTTQQETETVEIRTEDYASMLLRFGGKVPGSCTVSQVCAGRKNCVRFEIAGSKGSLAWNSESPNELWMGRRDSANESLIRDPALLHPSVRPFANYPGGHNEGFPDSFKQLFRAVYEAIDAGRTTGDFPTFEDGHREILLCEAILISHQERRWIDV